MKRNRFDKALEIQRGACNPIAVANEIVEIIKEIQQDYSADTKTITDDPAFRLAVHQLAFLAGTGELDSEFDAYHNAVRACEGKANLDYNRA